MSNEQALWQKQTYLWIDDSITAPAGDPGFQLRADVNSFWPQANQMLQRFRANTMGSQLPQGYNHYRGRRNPLGVIQMPMTDLAMVLSLGSLLQQDVAVADTTNGQLTFGSTEFDAMVPAISKWCGFQTGVGNGAAYQVLQAYGGVCSSVSITVPRVTETDLGQPTMSTNWMFAYGNEVTTFTGTGSNATADTQEPFNSTDLSISVTGGGALVSMDITLTNGCVKDPTKSITAGGMYLAGGISITGSVRTMINSQAYAVLMSAAAGNAASGTEQITLSATGSGGTNQIVVDALIGPPRYGNESGMAVASFPFTAINNDLTNLSIGWYVVGVTDLGWA